jgi:GntR family transcriptional regulator
MPIPLTAVQIADDMEDRIRAGEYKPAERLPSYVDLMRLYSIGYTTIAKVMTLLRDRGLVVGVPGRGVYVAERPPR